MSVTEKYQSLIDLANQLGVSSFDVRESDGVLKIDGVAGSAQAKQQLWDEYNRLDPGLSFGRSRDEHFRTGRRCGFRFRSSQRRRFNLYGSIRRHIEQNRFASRRELAENF